MKIQLAMLLVGVGLLLGGAQPLDLQRQIDAAAAKGGGKVTVPAGEWEVKPILMKSNVTLELSEGTVLLGSTNLLDYANADVPGTSRAFVEAEGVENIAIIGKGRFDGRGDGFVEHYAHGAAQPKVAPKMMKFAHCKNVRLEDFTYGRSGSWGIHLMASDGVTVRRVRCYNHFNRCNDGIDIESRNVLIEDCDIDSMDDAICFKSESEPSFIIENVIVRNCRIATTCNFIKFGTGSYGHWKNILIEKCYLHPASKATRHKWDQAGVVGVKAKVSGLAGMALEVVDGGTMEDVTIRDITMDGGVGTPIFVRFARRHAPKPGEQTYFKNVLIENVKMLKPAESRIASSITGLPGQRISGVTIRNCDLFFPGGGTSEEAADKKVPEVPTGYPEYIMFGIKRALPAYGFYVRHADDVIIENVNFRLAAPDARPKFHFEDFPNPSAAVIASSPICENSDVEITAGRIGYVRCAPAGVRVFADSFADRSAWPEVKNYENKLKLEFNHPWHGGTGLLVSGEKTPRCDTAWNVMTAPRKLTAKGKRYRFSFRVSSTANIAQSGSDTQGWWTSVRWYDSTGSQTNIQRVCWLVTAGPHGQIVNEGDIPAWADRYVVQIGYDHPNICEGNKVVVGDVRLDVFDGEPRYERRGWFCTSVLNGGAISWDAEVPKGCAVRLQCAGVDDLADMAKAPFVGPDGTDKTGWDRPFTIKRRFVRCRVELLGDGRVTPLFKSMQVGELPLGNWSKDYDQGPPLVTMHVESPTTNVNVPVVFHFGGSCGLIVWKTLKVKVDGKDALALAERRGNSLTLKPSTPWTQGVHHVELEAADWRGQVFRSHKCFFIGEAPKTSKITLRQDGMTLIDGKPFFPVGIYGVMRREFNAYNFDRACADLKRGGFNTIHSYASPHEDDFLDSAWRHGLRVWNVARFPDRRLIEVERHHPAILAWYLGDDTSANTTPQQLVDYNDSVKAVDPTRITTQADGVGAGEKGSNYTDFVQGTDNFLAEIYPIHETNVQTRVECVAKVIRDMKRVHADVDGARCGSPRSCWPIIQYFKGWGWQRFPTKDELDAMSWASIIHGAQGITWYTYGGTVEPERNKFNYGVTTSHDRWMNITNLATRISSLIPVLVEPSGEQPPAPKVVKGSARDALGNESVSCLLKRHEGRDYLFAVNSTPEPVEAKFSLANHGEEWEVLWENRKVKCVGNGFADRFAPFAVHVYRICPVAERRDP